MQAEPGFGGSVPYLPICNASRVLGGQTVRVRMLVGLVALVAALVLLGGPVFGFTVLVSGGDLHIRGGAPRLAFDLVVGLLLLGAAVRRLASRPRETAAYL